MFCPASVRLPSVSANPVQWCLTCWTSLASLLLTPLLLLLGWSGWQDEFSGSGSSTSWHTGIQAQDRRIAKLQKAFESGYHKNVGRAGSVLKAKLRDDGKALFAHLFADDSLSPVPLLIHQLQHVDGVKRHAGPIADPADLFEKARRMLNAKCGV